MGGRTILADSGILHLSSVHDMSWRPWLVGRMHQQKQFISNVWVASLLHFVATRAQDQSSHCADWAAVGECEINPEYMSTACAQSCAAHTDAKCAAWAANGECDKNPAYMLKACATYCTFTATTTSHEVVGDPMRTSSDETSGSMETVDASSTPDDSIADADAPAQTHAESDPACINHPGGCRCYYDALADGCPSAVPQGGLLALCSCDYRDNSWLRVFTSFLRFFGSDFDGRTGIVGAMVQDSGSGIFSMDMGLKNMVQCSEGHAWSWPGTMAKLDFDEIGKMANNIFFGQVRQALMDICAPGRFLLGMLCLHAVLHKGDAIAASLYSEAMLGIFERIHSCIEGNTPFPKLPGLYKYLKSWAQASIPPYENPRGVSLGTMRRLSWWPKDLRAKNPGEPGMNLWVCAPMRDLLCWQPGAQYQYESCEFCCDPAHGSHGAPICFDSLWSFARCCTTPGDRGYF